MKFVFLVCLAIHVNMPVTVGWVLALLPRTLPPRTTYSSRQWFWLKIHDRECCNKDNLPSSTSFLAAASKSITLGTKCTLYVLLGLLALLGSLAAIFFFLFVCWYSFSLWLQRFSCWSRLFLACFNLSWVLIFSTTTISVTRSACSVILDKDWIKEWMEGLYGIK